MNRGDGAILRENLIKPNFATVGSEAVLAKTRGMIRPQPNGSPCSEYRLGEWWLPVGLSEGDRRQLDGLVFSHRRLKPAQALYRSGDPCGSVYLLRSGFIKTVVLHLDGREQVSGFYMAGEMLGLDGIASGEHASDARALTDSDICVVPYKRLQTVSHEAQAMQRYLCRVLSQEIVRKQNMMVMLGSMRADQRVATFLLNLSGRLTAQGFSASDFLLRMTRDEIGSLLGMKLETVSRTFSKFKKANLTRIEGKHVRILSMEGLRAMLD